VKPLVSETQAGLLRLIKHASAKLSFDQLKKLAEKKKGKPAPSSEHYRIHKKFRYAEFAKDSLTICPLRFSCTF